MKKEKVRLKILLANIAFGLPRMDRFWSNIWGHIKVHSWKVVFLVPFLHKSFKGLLDFQSRLKRDRFEYLVKNSGLDKVLALINDLSPNVIIINELIFQIHKEEIEKELKKLSFNFFAWGKSNHHDDAIISILIASKIPFTTNNFNMVEPARMGGGGGIASVDFQDIKTTLIAPHLCLPGILGSTWKEQTKEIFKHLKEKRDKGNNIIMAGDFNETEEIVSKYIDFEALNLKPVNKEKIPTCPLWLPRRLQKAIDDIFIDRDFNILRKELKEFGSDHKSVFAEMEIND